MKLIKNFGYNLFYQILTLALPLITVPIVSRSLGPTALGEYSFTSATTQYFIIFGMIGISLYGTRKIATVKDDFRLMSKTFWDLYFMQFFFTSLSVIVYFACCVYFFNTKLYFVQSLLILSSVFDITWLFYGLEEVKPIVIKNTIIRVTSVVIIIFMVKSPEDIILYALILSFTNFVGHLSIWSTLFKIVDKPEISISRIKSNIKPCLILFIPQVASMIYLLLDRTMLGIFASYNEVGIYSQGQNIIRLILSIIPILSNVLLPRIAFLFINNEFDKINDLIYISSKYIWILSFGAMVGLIGVASTFVPLFYGNEFIDIVNVFYFASPLIIAVSGANILAVQYLIPTNQQNKYTFSVLIAAIVNLIFNIILIPRIGYIGACISTVLAEFIGFGIQVIFVRNKLSLFAIFKYIPHIVCASLMMLFVIVTIKLNVTQQFISVLLQVFLGGFTYLLFLKFFGVIDVNDVSRFQ